MRAIENRSAHAQDALAVLRGAGGEARLQPSPQLAGAQRLDHEVVRAAREGLDVVNIVFANRIYQILRGEFDGVGAGEPGKRAQDMLRIDRPTIDFVALARGMGVAGRAVTTADEFNAALAEAVAEPGPRLIEVQM